MLLSLPARRTPLLVFTVFVSVLLYCVHLFHEHRRHRRQAAQWKCQKAPSMPVKLPLGLDLLWRLSKWDANYKLPMLTVQFFKEMQVPTWEQSFLGVTALVTLDPQNVQAILATQFNHFELGAVRRGTFSPLLGNGIFTTDGKEWYVSSYPGQSSMAAAVVKGFPLQRQNKFPKLTRRHDREHSRALLKPQFASDQVADLDAFELHLDHFFRHLPVGADGWTGPVNLQPMFSRLIMDAATEFLCGESVFSQVLALPDDEEGSYKQSFRRRRGGGTLDWGGFADCFDRATKTLGMRIRLFDNYWLYSPPSFYRNCQKVHEFMDYYVYKALASKKHSEHDDTDAARTHVEVKEKHDSAKHKYVFLDELAKETRDPVELRSQLLNVLLAGRDTTAGCMSWLFYSLAREPRAFAKLRAAVIEDFGSADGRLGGNKPLTFANMKACKYLQWVLNETLRLYPNVAMNSRRATCDTTLPRGGGPDGLSPVYVRAGQEVNYYVLAMQRRRDLWGDDADDFAPERWDKRRRGWEFVPFNGGPRICMGQQLALSEAAFTVIRTLQRFDRIENLDPDPEIRHHYGVTTTPKQVLVRLHAAATD
jgi:cytochrome P450